jgi:hypothetical protein
MEPTDSVVIDDYNVESNVVADAAGLPIPRTHAYLANTQNDIKVQDYIAAEKPRFLVYSDQGTLRRSLSLPSQCAEHTEIDGIGYQCVFSNQIYRVYELNYR